MPPPNTLLVRIFEALPLGSSVVIFVFSFQWTQQGREEENQEREKEEQGPEEEEQGWEEEQGPEEEEQGQEEKQEPEEEEQGRGVEEQEQRWEETEEEEKAQKEEAEEEKKAQEEEEEEENWPIGLINSTKDRRFEDDRDNDGSAFQEHLRVRDIGSASKSCAREIVSKPKVLILPTIRAVLGYPEQLVIVCSLLSKIPG